MRCAKCGNRIQKNSKFCRYCGELVVEKEKLNNPINSKVLDGDSKGLSSIRFCRKCGCKLSNAERICDLCGTVSSKDQVGMCCEECDEWIPSDSKYCQYCGFKLNTNSDGTDSSAILIGGGAKEIKEYKHLLLWVSILLLDFGVFALISYMALLNSTGMGFLTIFLFVAGIALFLVFINDYKHMDYFCKFNKIFLTIGAIAAFFIICGLLDTNEYSSLLIVGLFIACYAWIFMLIKHYIIEKIDYYI